jgi:Sulfotransferase family
MHTTLAQHPDIFMSPYKEPSVLSNPRKDLSDYARLFAGSGTARYRGESSTSYLTIPSAISKFQLLPDLKLILMLRNPVDRAWSHYWFIKRYNADNRSFRSAFTADINTVPSFAIHNLHYYQVGLYSKWLALIETAITPDRILCVLFEDFVNDLETTMAHVYTFLGLPPTPGATIARRNESVRLRHSNLMKGYIAVAHAGGATIGRVLPSHVYNKVTDLNRRAGKWLSGKLRAGDVPSLESGERGWIADHYRTDVERLRQHLQRPLPWDDFSG